MKRNVGARIMISAVVALGMNAMSSIAEAEDVAAERPAPVAGALHTAVLLLILLGAAGGMYFSADRLRAVEHPNRLTFYFTTIAWEWFLTAYVLFGVRRHGNLLGEVTGAQWKTARDLFRDLGVALVFWIGALVFALFALTTLKLR